MPVITWATFSSDLIRQNVSTEMLKIQADQYWIENHEALLDVADVSGSGSDTAIIREDNLNGASAMVTIAEGGTYADATYDANRMTVAVAEYYAQWTVSDLARCVSQPGELDAGAFAYDILKRRALAWTTVLTLTAASFSAVHTMSAAPCVDDLMVASQKLELAKNDTSAIKIAVLDLHQWHSIKLDVAFVQALNVSVLHDPEIKAMAKMLGGVYKGRYEDMDIFVSHTVTQSGGLYQGAIWARGGIIKAKGRLAPEMSDDFMIEDTLFQRQASTTKPETTYRGKVFLGAAIGQQAAGIRFASPV